MMGLVITSMIMVAITAIMTSVARGWNEQRLTQSTQLQANQVYARVQRILSAAKYVVSPANNASASSIYFWDNDNLVPDNGIEAGELALIEWDSNTQSLFYYWANPSPSQMSAAQTYFNWASVPSAAQFKALPYVQQTALAGPGNSGNANALQVTGAQFYVTGLSSTNQLPIVEFTLWFTKNGQSVTLYNCTTMRSPTTQPN